MKEWEKSPSQNGRKTGAEGYSFAHRDSSAGADDEFRFLEQ